MVEKELIAKKLEKRILETWKKHDMVNDEKTAKHSIHALCYLLSEYGLNDFIRLLLDTDETIREVCDEMADELVKKEEKNKSKNKKDKKKLNQKIEK